MPDLLDGYSLSHILAHDEWDEDGACPDDRFAPLVCGIVLIVASIAGWLIIGGVTGCVVSLFG